MDSPETRFRRAPDAEPDIFDMGNRPTTFRDVFTALALCFLAIGLGIAAVVGVWQ